MTSKCFRLLAMMLSVLLVLSAIPIAAYAEALADLSLSASVTDTDSEASRETVIEVPELRTATDKYFLLSNGNYYVARYDTAVHYQDEDGVWQDIDNTLSASGNEISTGDAKIKFAKKTSGNETLFTLHDGNRKLTLSLCGANKKIEGVITNRESELSEDATELQRMTILHKISASVCYPDILTGVDLEYVIKGSDIKENIIVKEASESYAYSFTMALNNLSAETDETGGVLISDSATGELVYTIPAPTMWDANGIASDRVGMTLTPHGNGKYTLTVTADAEWMNAEDRAYPVTIDPPIYTGTAGGVLDLTVSSLTPNAASSTGTELKVSETHHAYWRLTSLPTIPDSAYITNAEITMNCIFAENLSGFVGAYDVTSDWDSMLAWNRTIQASNPQGAPGTDAVDFQHIYASDDGTLNDFDGYHWNITPVVKKWYTGENYGVMFAPIADEPFTGIALFHSNDYEVASARPVLCITYRDMKGLEDYWSYSSHSAGFAGSGSINLATGKLTFVIPTLTTADHLLPVTPALVFSGALGAKYHIQSNGLQTAFTTAAYGYGMTLNLDETVWPYTVGGVRYYVWTDGDGTEHYFSAKEGSETEYVDEDGLQLTLTVNSGTYTITDNDRNVRCFTGGYSAILGGGVLTSIRDKNGNEVTLTRDASSARITAVNLVPVGETAIEQLTLTYNTAGLLSEVRNSAAGEVVRFYYSSSFSVTSSVSRDGSGYLRKMEYCTGTNDTVAATAEYVYTGGQLIRVINTNTKSRLSYTYDGRFRVVGVIESELIGNTNGQELKLEYRPGSTVLHSSGCDDLLYETVNGEDEESDDNLLTTYVFDACGRVVSCYTTDFTGTVVYGASSGVYVDEAENENAKNKLGSTAVTTLSASNYLLNGGFESSGTTNSVSDYWTGNNTSVTVSTTAQYNGTRCARIVGGQTESRICQSVILPTGKYYLSAQVLTTDMTTATATVSVYANGSTLIEEEIPVNRNAANAGYTEVGMEIDTAALGLSAGTAVLIIFAVKGGTSAEELRIDNVMLSRTIGAASYDMITMGHFESTHPALTLANAWDSSVDEATVYAEGSHFGNVLKVENDIGTPGFVSQVIYRASEEEKAAYSEGSVNTDPVLYTVSGWGKGIGPCYAETSQFGIYVEVKYYQSESRSYTEDFYFDFCKDSTDWQFLSGGFATNPNRGMVEEITVKLAYIHNVGVAYFDEISLVRDSSATAVYDYNAAGYTTSYYSGKNGAYYFYDAMNRVVGMVTTDGKSVEYTYDVNGNPGGELHSINGVAKTRYDYVYNTYGLCEFTQMTDMESETLQQYVTISEYVTDSGSHIFGALKSETDALAQVTEYFYDENNGRLKAVIYPAGNGTAYVYDAIGNLVSVTPASGTDSGYEADQNSASVGYTYDSTTHRLTAISTESSTYNFVYDNFGNTTAIGVGGNTLASYTYASHNGKLQKLTYGNGFAVKYVYDALDRISEIQYNVGSGGEYETVYRYTYDSYGRLRSVSDVRKGQTTYYEYDAAGKLRQSVLVDGSGSNATNLLGTSYGYDEKSRLTDAFYGFDYYAPGGYKAEDLYYHYQYHDDDKLQSMRFETTDRRVTGNIVPTYDNLGRTASRVSFFLVNSADAFYREEGFSYNTYYDAEYGLVCQSAQVSEYTSGIAVSGTATQDVTTYGFTYDENGNITEICDSEGSVQRKYYYDDLGQLIREDNRSLNKTYVWTYDNAGNIKSKKTYAFTTGALGAVQSTQNYTYGNSAWKDLLTKVGDCEIAYDAIGNPTEMQFNYDNDEYDAYELTWEDGRTLAEIDFYEKYNEGSFELSFEYNADGIRMSKTYYNDYGMDWYRIDYVVSGSCIVSETRYDNDWEDSWNEVYTIIYIYGTTASPIGMMYRTPSYAQGVYDCFFFDKNLQGDIVAVYNASGTKVVSYTYDAWGNCTESYPAGYSAASAAMRNPFRYRGYYYDAETEWYYLQTRYYNPAWGRFINADGYVNANGDIIGFNMFAYCSNNPVMLVDRSGNAAIYVVADTFPMAGHAVVYIETPTGWYKVEFGASTWKKRDAVVMISGPMDYDSVMNQINNSNWECRGMIYIEGDFTESYERALYYLNNPESNPYDGKYWLISNNCLHFAKEILSCGKPYDNKIADFIKSSDHIIPISFFNELKDFMYLCTLINRYETMMMRRRRTTFDNNAISKVQAHMPIRVH